MKQEFFSVNLAIIIFIVILGSFSITNKIRAATFVNNGVAVSEIVLPETPQEREQSAANDLQEYFQKISGATVPIVTEGALTTYPIYIGNTLAAETESLTTQVASLADDSYIIKITPTATYLVGKDPLATAFASYGLLEDHLGVRWFMPGDLGEYVPTTQTISISDQTEIKEPSFMMRKVSPQGDWGRHNRMNSTNVDNTIYGMRMKWGYHTWYKFIPSVDYYAKHSNYFAMVNGVRTVTLDIDDGQKNQLETGNPALVDEFVSKVIQMFDNNPEIDIVSISANDGSGFSESPESVALDDQNYPCTVQQINNKICHSDDKYGVLSKRMLTFYKEVSDRVLAIYPNKYLLAGAYSFYRTPPENINITMPNGSIAYITRQTCHNLPLSENGCNKIYNNTINGWLNYFNSFMIYEYYWKVAALGLPYPIIHSIREDIPYFYQKNAFGLSSQTTAANVGTLHLNYYIASKLLWDVNVDVDALLEDYYTKFYGPASMPMKQYYETLEQTIIDHPEIELPAKYYELLELFNQTLLTELSGYITQAKILASSDAVRLERVEIQEASLGYLQHVIEYLTDLKTHLDNYPSLWDIQEDTNDLPLSHQTKANEIEQYLQDHESQKIVKITNNSYINNLLTPEIALNKIAGCEDSRIVLEKQEWVENGGIDKSIDGEEIVDIWIYGYDYDADVDKAEHEVSLIDNVDQNILLGNLPEINDNHSGENYTRIFKNINVSQFLVDNKLQLRILNKEGHWTQSNFNAVYIIPHDVSITNSEATQKIEDTTERNNLRDQSFGFVEYCPEGIANKDSDILEINIQSRFITTIRADVDQQNGITSTDAMLILRNSLELNMTNTNWQSSNTTGDVNCDGITNTTDAMLILRYSLGLDMSGWCVE